jgi:hypothetical protein
MLKFFVHHHGHPQLAKELKLQQVMYTIVLKSGKYRTREVENIDKIKVKEVRHSELKIHSKSHFICYLNMFLLVYGAMIKGSDSSLTSALYGMLICFDGYSSKNQARLKTDVLLYTIK